MRRLPQFSIAQLLGFTLVCALSMGAFAWDFGLGFWTTLLSQCLFWTLLRVNAGLRLDPELKTNVVTHRLDWTITKLFGVSVLCTLAGVIAFSTVCTITAAPFAIDEMLVTRSGQSYLFPLILFGVSIPLGTLAAAVWLWWTWPRKQSK
jgi:hypothetical protein